MPKCYVIGDVTVTNPERYPDYSSQTEATLEPFGGRFIVQGSGGPAARGRVDARPRRRHRVPRPRVGAGLVGLRRLRGDQADPPRGVDRQPDPRRRLPGLNELRQRVLAAVGERLAVADEQYVEVEVEQLRQPLTQAAFLDLRVIADVLVGDEVQVLPVAHRRVADQQQAWPHRDVDGSLVRPSGLDRVHRALRRRRVAERVRLHRRLLADLVQTLL